MDINWELALSACNGITDKWEFFKDKYNSAINKHIPTKLHKNRKFYKTPLDRETRRKVRHLVNRKDKLWKRSRVEKN